MKPPTAPPAPPKPLSQWTDGECIAYLCFIGETVAHLQSRERDILPITERVRAWLTSSRAAGLLTLEELSEVLLCVRREAAVERHAAKNPLTRMDLRERE